MPVGLPWANPCSKLVDAIVKELLQLKEPSLYDSCQEFFIPQLGEPWMLAGIGCN
jgi:hypothetical protein